MKYFVVILSLMFILLSSCQESPSGSNSDKIRIATTILPIADFINKIGGDKVIINVMVAPGRSPEEYEPTPEQLRSISRTDIYVKVGGPFPFEKIWIEKITADNNKIRIIDCSNGVTFKNNDPHFGLGLMKSKQLV